jgi:predicted metal-dependent peptidase
MTNGMGTKHPMFVGVKTALLLHVPFFASLLLDIMDVRIGKFPHIFPPGMETMATDGKTVYIDEDFLTNIKLEEAVFGVCHEVGHAMWEHMQRGKAYEDTGFDGNPFSPELYNIAADYIINDLLDKSKVGAIRRDAQGNPVWLLDPKYTHDMSVEEVYRDLWKNAKKVKGVGKAGEGGQVGQGVHIYDTGKVSSAEMKRAVQTALDTAKACGKLPGALKRYAEEFLEPKVKWQDILRTTIVTSADRDTSTWARPHRRKLASQRIYLPRAASFGCHCIVVAVDTSGSIGRKELNAFFSELADILRTCHPETTWVLGADSVVASSIMLEGNHDITSNPPEVGGGGGTDFKPVFEWVEHEQLVPDALVYFTDLWGPFPKRGPDYPVIWCSTTAQEAPFGKTIHIDVL